MLAWYYTIKDTRVQLRQGILACRMCHINKIKTPNIQVENEWRVYEWLLIEMYIFVSSINKLSFPYNEGRIFI